MSHDQNEQELARALLLDAQRGRLAQGLSERLRASPADDADIIATLLAILVQKGSLSPIEAARVVVRSAQLSQANREAAQPAAAVAPAGRETVALHPAAASM